MQGQCKPSAIELARIAEVQPNFAVVSTAKIRRILDSSKIFAFFLRFLPSPLFLLTSYLRLPTSALFLLTSFLYHITSARSNIG